jgi:ABC-type branched-subunit amino acid transport system ATPase component
VEYLKRGKLTLDDIHTVMRVEHLSQDFNRFKVKENLTITIHTKNCRAKDDTIKKFLEVNPDMVNRILKLYAEDIELYKEVEERIRRDVCI